MKIICDTLEAVKKLTSSNMSREDAEAIISMLSDIEIKNLYSSEEVEKMVAESVDRLLKEFRRESDQRHKEFNNRMDREGQEFNKRLDREAQETKVYRRWLMGIGIGIAASVITLIIKIN